MRIGIIGYRSWIAKRLDLALRAKDHEVILYEKEWTAEQEVSLMRLDRLYLFAGRSDPGADEMEAEIALIRRVLQTGIRCQVVYMSSRAMWDRGFDDPYAKHKTRCENVITEHPWSKSWLILRPPAVFGPGQPADSKMLIPSLRRDPYLELKTPDKPSHFIHVRDLVAQLVELPWRDGPVMDFLGTFTVRPSILRDLRQIWL